MQFVLDATEHMKMIRVYGNILSYTGRRVNVRKNTLSLERSPLEVDRDMKGVCFG